MSAAAATTPQQQTAPPPASLLDQITNVAEREAAARYMPVLPGAALVARRKQVQWFVDNCLQPGVDYGVIPGTQGKPSLWKSGAEAINAFFGYSPVYTDLAVVQDWSGDQYGEPFHYFRKCCTLTRDGVPVGQGNGSASTWESKYRYRWVAEDQVPASLDRETLQKRAGTRTEPEFAIQAAQTDGKYGKPADYWEEFREAIERGEAVEVSREIKTGAKAGQKMKCWQIDSVVYRIPNPDIADVINTAEKIADKRAYIAATLTATGLSSMFGQDLGDDPADGRQRAAAKPAAAPVPAQPKQQKAKPAAAPAPATEAGAAPFDWKKQMAAFAEMRGVIGETEYKRILAGFDVAEANELGTIERFHAAYQQMVAFAKSGAEVAQ